MNSEKKWIVRSKSSIPIKFDEAERQRGDFQLNWLNDTSFIITNRFSNIYLVFYLFYLFIFE